MKQCWPLAQALIEAKTEIDNEQCQDTVKREEKNTNKEKKQQTNEPLWRFTWVKTHVHRCEGQRAQRFAKRWERYVEKTGADGIGWFMWCLFQYNSYLKYSSKSTDRIFR